MKNTFLKSTSRSLTSHTKKLANIFKAQIIEQQPQGKLIVRCLSLNNTEYQKLSRTEKSQRKVC
jgi:hypothetical protein